MKESSMFMTAADLHDLTGQVRPLSQAQWLRSKTVPFMMGGDGKLKVSKEALASVMDKELSDPQSCEKEASGQIPSWDKVEESHMAGLLGTTSRALQGRRSRGAIPPDVWCNVAGRIMYSLKRYDDWLESLWPAYVPPESTAKPTRRTRQKTTLGDVYKLV